jgi:hypothetical protein
MELCDCGRGEGAHPVSVPDLTIALAGARLLRSRRVDSDPGPTSIPSSLSAAGRARRGERFGVEVWRRAGGDCRLLFDHLEFTPMGHPCDGLRLRFGSYFRSGPLYARAPRLAAWRRHRREERAGAGMDAGRPEPRMAVAHGPVAAEGPDLLSHAWDLLRRALVGKPAPRPGKS